MLLLAIESTNELFDNGMWMKLIKLNHLCNNPTLKNWWCNK